MINRLWNAMWNHDPRPKSSDPAKPCIHSPTTNDTMQLSVAIFILSSKKTQPFSHDYSVMTILTISFTHNLQVFFTHNLDYLLQFFEVDLGLSCPTYINSPLSSHVWRIPESTIDRHQKLRWPDSSNLVWNPDPRPKQKHGESGNLEDWEPVFV